MTPRELVVWALEQGHSEPGDIASVTGLPRDHVYVALARLTDNRVTVKVSRSCWKLKKDECLLAQMWK